MEREIKFRGLRTDGKGMVYGDLLCRRFENTMILNEDDGDEYNVIPESVGQFTGILDLDNNEIYEGDKLRCIVQNKVYIVKWHQQQTSWWINETPDHLLALSNTSLGDGYLKRRDLKLIGNIHQQ